MHISSLFISFSCEYCRVKSYCFICLSYWPVNHSEIHSLIFSSCRFTTWWSCSVTVRPVLHLPISATYRKGKKHQQQFVGVLMSPPTGKDSYGCCNFNTAGIKCFSYKALLSGSFIYIHLIFCYIIFSCNMFIFWIVLHEKLQYMKPIML